MDPEYKEASEEVLKAYSVIVNEMMKNDSVEAIAKVPNNDNTEEMTIIVKLEFKKL